MRSTKQIIKSGEALLKRIGERRWVRAGFDVRLAYRWMRGGKTLATIYRIGNGYQVYEGGLHSSLKLAKIEAETNALREMK